MKNNRNAKFDSKYEKISNEFSGSDKIINVSFLCENLGKMKSYE